MSDPPSSGQGPEFAIDLDAEAAAEAPPPRRRLRIPNSSMGIAAALLTLAAAVVAVVEWDPGRDPVAEATVRAFLEAVHDGDVDGALALTDEPDAEGDFLVPEALDSRWKINRVSQVAYSENENGFALARVYAEIEAEDGTVLGHRYAVRVEGDRALISNPLIDSHYYPTVGHLELNGVAVEAEEELSLRLLPGQYTLYETVPDTLAVEAPAALALGREFRQLGQDYTSDFLPWAEVRATESGLAQVEALMRERFEACLASPGAQENEQCPLSLPQDDRRELEVAEGQDWEITAHPEVSLNAWYEPELGFQLVTVEPGRAEVTVDVTESDGSTERAVLSCAIWVEHLYAAFDFDGGVALRAGPGADRSCNAMVEAP